MVIPIIIRDYATRMAQTALRGRKKEANLGASWVFTHEAPKFARFFGYGSLGIPVVIPQIWDLPTEIPKDPRILFMNEWAL
jgi:hypothetical protein